MLPADTPKLPKWPFLVGDAALLGLAWLIGDQSRNPFAGTALVSIVICVVCGAVLGAVPFLADYARKQDEALDERQRGLEALSRTVAASAEQIGIAANGLHEIVEVAQRNLKTAEQLPARLQEKIGAIKIQADPPRETRDAEKDDLKKEVARLRAADAERLQSATDKLVKAAAELSKLASARSESVRSSEPARSAPAEAPAPPPVQVVAAPPAPTREPAAVAREDSPASPPAGEAVPPPPTPPKRPRKPRPETSDANATPVADVSPAPKAEPEPAPIPVATIPEVVPVAPDSHTPFTPPAEASHAPASTEPPTPEATPASIPASAPAAAEAVKPPERKRAPRKPRPEVSAAAPATATASANTNAQIPDDEPTLNLGDSSPEPESASVSAPAERNERSVSSDGATRLLVTAYIGIGNRLFIRGSGPGLRWDKGLPLQFVSIGKWRWETNDATAPVQFKLYKNDDSECASLGTQTLDPGQQEEVTATF
jgi:hypothetical protein